MASRLSQADFIEVRYSRFHKLHGKNVVLSEDGCSARRERGYDRAVVFSSYPIPVGSRFQLAVEGIEQEWSGSLRFGVTTCNPSIINRIPASAIECYDSGEYWILSDKQLYHRKRVKKSLVSMQDLTVGNTVGCQVTRKGKLEIFLNGISLGITWDGLPTGRPIWGFADLYGKITEVRSNFVCDSSYSRPELSAVPTAAQASSRSGLNTQSSLPSQLVAKVDPHIQQRDETIAVLQQELAAERQSKEELIRTWKMANEEFMQMQKDREQEMKEVHQQLDVAQRQLKAVQIHVQQVLGLQQNVANGKSCDTLSGNGQDSIQLEADNNSVYSMLHVLKQHLQELLTGEEGTACDSCSRVHGIAQQHTMRLPSDIKEDGVTVNSLLAGLKLKICDQQREGQFVRRQMESQKKQIKALEADVTRYQVALAQLEKERETLGSTYETKYLYLIQELQKHVSSFRDSARETQSELETVKAEFAAMKREAEVNSQPSIHDQEWEDEKACDKRPCSGKGSSEGSSDGNTVIQEEEITVAARDIDAGTGLH